MRLGPVGGRIVGEVIIGLLQTDPASYLDDEARAGSRRPSRERCGFRMIDFLTLRRASTRSRGQ